MLREPGFPLDYEERGYAYLERPNSVLVELVNEHVLRSQDSPSILDVGCGAGANIRRWRQLCPTAVVVGVEPNAQAAELARSCADKIFQGTAEQWLATAPAARFDAVVLSDVLEHLADPVGLLRSLLALDGLQGATWFVSVPNYAVWYNRLRTLAGKFEYAWSGLYDRTHLRFFTRRSLCATLSHSGLDTVTVRCSPSLAQSAAPLLRLAYQQQVRRQHTLALEDSLPFRAYRRLVEPAETRVCEVWPELLGFQIVVVARPRAPSSSVAG